MSRSLPAFIASIILLVLSTGCLAMPALPDSPSDFVGTWHGYSDYELEFIRLEMRKDGTGVMALSELPNSPADIYRIHWRQVSVGSYHLSIRAKVANPTAEPITLWNVYNDGPVLIFQVGGQGWSRHFVLFNEQEFARRATAARRALKKLR